MDKPGKLKLTCIDVFGDTLAEKIDVFLRHQTLSETVAARGVDSRRSILIKDLRAVPQGLYRIDVDPPSYLAVSRFVNIAADRVTDKVFTFAVDPRKVLRVRFPAYVELPHGRELIDAASYNALDDIRRAGFLNIVAKAARTATAGGRTVLGYIGRLLELRGDRFFAVVPPKLREDVRNSVPAGLFEEVNGALHRPPEGYKLHSSFKTPDSFGNLQITFFNRTDEDWVADIDIDDANGLRHCFQVLRNELTGRPTHPYDIAQILVTQQEIDPGYRFVLREPEVRRAAGGD